MDFAVPAHCREKAKESKTIDKYLNVERDQKKKHRRIKGVSYTNYRWRDWNSLQGRWKDTRWIKNLSKNRDYLDHILKLALNWK